MFDITKVQDVSILHLHGEISLLEFEMIQRIIDSFKRHHHMKILLDLAQVDYIHFKAIYHLARKAVELRSFEGDLKLASLNPKTKQVLVFTGADQYLTDYATVGEAVLSFLKNPGKNYSQDQKKTESSDENKKRNGLNLSPDETWFH